MLSVAGIRIEESLLEAWQNWLAPVEQPFFVDAASQWPEGRPGSQAELSAELRDTFKVWRMHDASEIVWLNEQAFYGIDRGRRRRLVRSQVDRRRGATPTVRRWADLLDATRLRAQADGHRFVWWESMFDGSRDRILERFAKNEGDRARHHHVPASTWRKCGPLLPAARDLAGTFAMGSGPNCFGTVMAAAGMSRAADTWMLQAPFDSWLDSACVSGGRDNEPGTVLVWRDSARMPVHAAVTIGDGYALEKAAQTWWTPRVVVSVEEVKRSSRASGQRLERHRVVAAQAP